jgi:hypothetical protein
MPNSDCMNSRAAGADQAIEAEDFAPAQLEADVLEFGGMA